MRSANSFAVSACLHGGILGWVAFGPGLPATEPARKIYDREIRPNEKKIVWYSLREKLPDVAPADAHPDPRPPRARVKFDQTMVSGAKDDHRPPQMIWTPEPPVEQAKPAPLPNVVAVAPAPRPVRPFVAPPTQPRPNTSASPALPPALPPELPDGPRASTAEAKPVPLLSAGPRPQPLPFTPPPDVRIERKAVLLLPDAPAVHAAVEVKGMDVKGSPIAAPLPKLQPLAFTAPPGAKSQPAPAGLPAAPDISAPPLSASLAMIGLNPANTTVVPAPPGSREAGFSAGTVVRQGGMGENHSGAQVSVPGLLLRGGVKDDQPALVANFSPTSRENLREASRIALGSAPAATAASAGLRATRVSNAPDPRLAGRLVYTVAIQMPNVTSYSGSWIVWFAVREASTAPGAQSNPAGPAPVIRPPLPLRKVDPKYIQSAVSDRVEGKVLLRAVIRTDGLVESVVLLRGVDDRLDRSAAEALAKWAFEPAMRDGSPVDVDAVFEIPFHLPPKPLK